jgi:hypothetical protein
MSASPTDIVFMPGFDGVGELRREFVEALASIAPARAIDYPNRTLESLSGYARYASSQVSPQSRPVLVAESFSGLVATLGRARSMWRRSSCAAPSQQSESAFGSRRLREPGTAGFLGASIMSPVTLPVA